MFLELQIQNTFFQKFIHIDYTGKPFHSVPDFFHRRVDIGLGTSGRGVTEQALNHEDIHIFII